MKLYMRTGYYINVYSENIKDDIYVIVPEHYGETSIDENEEIYNIIQEELEKNPLITSDDLERIFLEKDYVSNVIFGVEN